jgi:hypothetical protein
VQAVTVDSKPASVPPYSPLLVDAANTQAVHARMDCKRTTRRQATMILRPD